MDGHVFHFLVLILAVGIRATEMQNSLPSREKYASAIKKESLNQKYVPAAVRESCKTSSGILDNRINTTDRLRRLRLGMKASNYDAYIVPSSDEHQSEYVADHDKRRQFISGFTGSAGTALILQNVALLWTDGRYFLQGEKELDCNWILMKKSQKNVDSIDVWIVNNLKEGSIVGADSKLVPYKEWLYLKKKFALANITLLADENNLIDGIWNIPQGRSPESVTHIFIHDVKYAGRTWRDKVEDVMEVLRKNGATGLIISALDEVAWLFNLRGHDVNYTPIFKSYAFISEQYIRLYVKRLKLTSEIEKYLCPKGINGSLCVEVVEYTEAFQDMKELISQSEKTLVSSYSSYAIISLIDEEKRIIQEGPSPVAVLKVIKNPTEIIGMKNAALRDSVSIISFISMLDEEVKYGKHWDELKAAKTLLKYRNEQALFQGESFETISAFGRNAAVIHYKPQISTNRNINPKNVYLLDSGGQYLDGTTDITRTFHFGEPTDFQIEVYTKVLMGAIDLITFIFPEGVLDTELDIIARRPLYNIGLNYLHGTGHGIGSFLGVHEGPIGISSKGCKYGYALKPGMFLSNEPGFYAAQEFGIRLETMMTIVKANTPYNFSSIEHFAFEAVSFVPFEPKLIDLHLLNKKQKEWLNWYNMKTRNTVGIELQKQNKKQAFHWLLSKTEYIPVEDSFSSCISATSTVQSFKSIIYFLSFVYVILF